MSLSRNPFFRLGIVLGIILPSIAGGFFLATTSFTPPPPKGVACSLMIPPATPSDQEVFSVADQMPLFPGASCGDLKSYHKRKACADKALLNYIYQHIRYPANARESSVEGMAVVSFVVRKNGVITKIKTVRDPGAGLGKEAEKVIRKMRDENLRWEPGLVKGKPANVRFNVPVKFKLE